MGIESQSFYCTFMKEAFEKTICLMKIFPSFTPFYSTIKSKHGTLTR